MCRRWTGVALAVAFLAALAAAPSAGASSSIRYGIQDDAWLQYGPGGSVGDRLDELRDLGVDAVRYTLRWDRIAAKRPAAATDQRDPAYRWGAADEILRGLHARGIAPVVTLYGAPRWANGGRAPNWAPRSGASFAAFAYAAARRYPFVRYWLVWNEPNQRVSLRPTLPAVYVSRLLNPAYAALHGATRGVKVGGGETAPRGGKGGVSPVDWIRGMRSAGARLDAYAHHPYPLVPRSESPSRGGCTHCKTITMATLERLLAEVQRSFGPKRIWLTEFGYQTDPPDRLLGVSPAIQARYIGEAALRAYRAPRVDFLIQFIYRDEPDSARWQSGLVTSRGAAKPARSAFSLVLAQAVRVGSRTVLWGQIRPRSGRQPYRLQVRRGGRWVWTGGTRLTSSRGFFGVTVSASRGTKARIFSPRDGRYSLVLTVG